MKKILLSLLFISLSAQASFFVPPGSISTAKLADGAVTPVKRAALGQQVSSSSGNFTSSSNSYVDITNLSVTITTTGRPVLIALIPDASGNVCSVAALETGTPPTSVGMQMQFVRDSTSIGEEAPALQIPGTSATTMTAAWPCSAYQIIDVGASAGSHTYKIQGKNFISTSFFFEYAKLIAYEL